MNENARERKSPACGRWIISTPLALVVLFAAIGSEGGSSTLPPASATTADDRKPSHGILRDLTARKIDIEVAFENTDITTVSQQIFADVLGYPFSVAPEVKGSVSFRASGRLSPNDLLNLYSDALSLQGFSLIVSNDQIRVTSLAKAREVTPRISKIDPAMRTNLAPGYVTAALGLRTARVGEVSKLLAAIAPRLTVLYADEERNVLLVAGDRADVDAATKAIRLFDDDSGQGKQYEIFAIQNSDVEKIAADATKVLQTLRTPPVNIMPLARIGSVIIISSDEQGAIAAKTWLATLDAASGSAQRTWNLYRPRHVSAQHLADLVGGLTNMAAQPASAEATQTTNAKRVIADARANTLVVKANPDEWTDMKGLLEALDQPVLQIMVEATIVEVSLTNEFRYGVDWSTTFGSTGKAGYSSASNGAVSPRFPGFTVSYINADVSAALSALAAKTDIQVVSSPKVIALNGDTALLQVGDEVPIVTQTAQSTQTGTAPILTTLSYRETGVILRVTPQIVGGGNVNIQIQQEVSDVARTTTSGIDSPTFQQRKIESRLSVPSGQTIAMGGLISTNKTKSRGGIPVLKDAPIVGGLFGSDANVEKRTELIIFLTPRILPVSSPDENAVAQGMSVLGQRGLTR